MDKQRVIEIAQENSSRVDEYTIEGEDHDEFVFTEDDVLRLVAAILLEAAKVCNDTQERLYVIDNRAGCLMCKNKLEQLAKELTQ